MTWRLDAIARRARAAGRPTSPALSEAEARARLAACDGPVQTAIDLEARFGGLAVGAYVLGLDTHRTHPPKDSSAGGWGASPKWLDRSLQRALVQIAFGGPYRSTYWLDDLGWVHEIGPLDRLRPVAERVDAFLDAIVADHGLSAHHGIVALRPLSDEDADAFFDSVERCPIGPGVVRWGAHARRFLEEEPWFARQPGPGHCVVSAPSLEDLARPLAELLTVEPSIEVVFVDAAPRAAYDVTWSEVWAKADYRMPWSDTVWRCAMGLDDRGIPSIGAAPP